MNVRAWDVWQIQVKKPLKAWRGKNLILYTLIYLYYSVLGTDTASNGEATVYRGDCLNVRLL
jgi:hypothetical protein